MQSIVRCCRIAVLPLVVLLAACGGTVRTDDADAGKLAVHDSGTIQFADAGPHDAGLPDDGGVTEDGGVLVVDAGTDGGEPVKEDGGTVVDGGPRDAGVSVDGGDCVGETDQELCDGDYDECGVPTLIDSCGVTRTPFCGTCGTNATCSGIYTCRCDQGYSGDGFTCDVCVPESDADLCAYYYDDCGTPTLTDSCGFDREVTCGTCGDHATCDPDYYYCGCDQGYSGDGQTCEVCTPQSDEEYCYDNYYQCGALDSTDNCGFPRTVDCGNCSGHGTCDFLDYCTCDTGFTNSGTACVPELGMGCLVGDGAQHDCPDGQVCLGVDGVNICTIVGCTTDTECGSNSFYDNSCAPLNGSTYCQPHCDPSSPVSCNSPDMVCLSLYPSGSGGVCAPSCRLQSSTFCSAATYGESCNPLVGSCDITSCSRTVDCPSGQVCFEDVGLEPPWQYCVPDCRLSGADECPAGHTCSTLTGTCDADAPVDGGFVDGGTTLPDGGTCVPETDEELCADADALCGDYPRTDSCGHVRNPHCGDCAGDTYCDRELLKCTCRPGFNELDGGACGIGIGQTCLTGDGTQQDCPTGQVCLEEGPVNLCTVVDCVSSSDCGSNGWKSNVCTTDGICVPRCDPTLGTTACGSADLVCYPTSTYNGDCGLDCRLAAPDFCDGSGYGAVCDQTNGRCSYKFCSDLLECDSTEVCFADTQFSPVAHFCLPDCKQGALCPEGRVCNEVSGVCDVVEPALDGGTAVDSDGGP